MTFSSPFLERLNWKFQCRGPIFLCHPDIMANKRLFRIFMLDRSCLLCCTCMLYAERVEARMRSYSSLFESFGRQEAHFLNKSKFVTSSCLARDPRVHAQLKNKAGFFKHKKLEILGSWAFAIVEPSMKLCSESWSIAQAQPIKPWLSTAQE